MWISRRRDQLYCAALWPVSVLLIHGCGGQKIPDAQPIQLPNNAIFDPAATNTISSGCPGGGIFTPGTNTQSANSAFPTYIFYGGINTNGAGTITLGAGQYVLAGTAGNNTYPGCGCTGDNLLATKNTTFQDSGMGTSSSVPGEMLILTDGQYSGLTTQVTGIPNWNCTAATCGGTNSLINPTLINPATGENYLTQGSVETKDSPMSLDGFDKNNLASSVPSLDQYTGVLVWQDRRNSTDIIDPATGNLIACYVNCGSNTPTTAQYEANNVTATSPVYP